MYIDEGRPTGTIEEDCWETYRRCGSLLTHLGIQYALRKVEPSSQQPCTWAGTMDHTENVVLGMVSQEKWEKTQRQIKEVREILEAGTKMHICILQ